MSGPKILSITTREERIEECMALLAQLDRAVEKWMAAGHDSKTITETDGECVERVRRRLHALLDTDQFDALRSGVQGEITFLERDRESRLKRAARAAAERAGRMRRFQGMAAALLVMPRSETVDHLPSEVEAALDAVRSGAVEDLGEAERILVDAIARGGPEVGSEVGSETASEAQWRLARELGAGLESVRFTSWLAEHGSDPLDQQLQRADGLIAEIELREGAAAVHPFLDRAEAIGAEPDGQRKRLLADSLVVDLAAYSRNARDLETRLDELVILRGELERLGCTESDTLTASMEEALATRSIEAMDALVRVTREQVDAERRRRTAAGRRASLLSALEQLGYEVREGMETAVPSGDRMVLRSHARPDYGLEISGPGQRLQLRPVTFREAEKSAERAADLAFESFWCGQLEELRARIDRLGGSLQIERATPVGKVPLKRLDRAPDRRSRRAAQRAPRARER